MAYEVVRLAAWWRGYWPAWMAEQRAADPWLWWVLLAWLLLALACSRAIWRAGEES